MPTENKQTREMREMIASIKNTVVDAINIAKHPNLRSLDDINDIIKDLTNIKLELTTGTEKESIFAIQKKAEKTFSAFDEYLKNNGFTGLICKEKKH
jgi:hypothetical protein